MELLQITIDCYYKLRQLDYKVRHGLLRCYYRLRQVLQSAMDLLQIATGITKRDDYYKLRQYKRVMLHVQPMDSIGRLSNPPRNIAIVYTSGFILWLDFR